MNHFMLDLETMGTGPDAAIVAIGAVPFDPDAGALGAGFYRAVSLESAVTWGGKITASTIVWWLQQSYAARHALVGGSAGGIRIVLRHLYEWMHDEARGADPIVWGNGSDFDNVVLRSAYERCGIEAPWSFRDNRCYRTLRALRPDVVMDKRIGTHHNAQDDALSQAQHALAIFAAMRG